MSRTLLTMVGAFWYGFRLSFPAIGAIILAFQGRGLDAIALAILFSAETLAIAIDKKTLNFTINSYNYLDKQTRLVNEWYW